MLSSPSLPSTLYFSPPVYSTAAIPNPKRPATPAHCCFNKAAAPVNVAAGEGLALVGAELVVVATAEVEAGADDDKTVPAGAVAEAVGRVIVTLAEPQYCTANWRVAC